MLQYAGLRWPGKPTSGATWRCVCDCGTTKEQVRAHYLIHGKTRSCGCLHRELLGNKARSHGLCSTHKNLYTIWQGIKTRCFNQAHKSYPRYGGTGITMHPAWRDSFPAFLAGVGPRPSKLHSLDRYPDPFGNYEPGNVRWATDSEQANNTRRTVRYRFKGEMMTLTEISRIENVSFVSVYQYVKSGEIDVEAAVKQARERGLLFLERSALHGGSEDARRTNQKRVRRKPQPASP